MPDVTGILDNDSAIQISLFPAEYTVDGVPSTDNANKIVLTDSNLYIIRDSINGPYVHFSMPATRDQFDRPSVRVYTVTTDDHVVTFSRATSCACGSRLRGVNPFRGLPHWRVKPVNG